ncbi:17577_t:CDS:2 [Rhizophagus irregularis]|nr:17577_t:CDS:2 [Rhizophagus irregularis]
MNSTSTKQSTTIGLTRQTFESEGPLNTMEKGGGFLDNTFKLTGYRKRRLSKLPAPVIIPTPSIIISRSPVTPQSPTKRFVLKPISALTAALQRTTITARKSSSMTLLKFQKSLSNNNNLHHQKSSSPKLSPSPQSPKPPKSPKLLYRKGSSGSIRKRSETLPISPSELAERLRESCSNSAKFEDENFSCYYDENNGNIIKPYRLPKPILIDVRNLSLYQNEHIRDSFNVNLPTLLIKRYRRGNMSNFSLDSFITTPECKDKYLDTINEDGGKYYHDIIIFDEMMDENDKISPSWTLLNVLERVMSSYYANNSNDSIDEINELPRGRVYWLKGGFEAFRSWDQRGEFIVNDIGSMSDEKNDDSTLMEYEGQEQGSNLVRRDSLFSVNTERSSLRRKKSVKQPKTCGTKQAEIPRGRRPSNGLQQILTPTCKLETLPFYPTASYGVHDFSDDSSLDTPPPVTHPEIAFEVSTIIPGFLYLGPEITKEDEVKQLEDKGVKRILNMAFEYVEKGLKIAVNFIERAQEDNTPIYVHCRAGKSRSVTAVLAYLIKARQWTLRHSYDYVMERRNNISPNIGFVAELMRIEEDVLGFKRSGGPNSGAVTEPISRKKEEMMDMEGVEPLGRSPKTAFF